MIVLHETPYLLWENEHAVADARGITTVRIAGSSITAPIVKI